MKKTPEQLLEKLYARLPKINCKRKCQACCGPISMTEFEMTRLTSRYPELNAQRATMALESGQVIGESFASKSPVCPLLGPAGECSAYPVRPMICRLWGLVQSMRCPFGCTPERWVSGKEAFAFLTEAMKISNRAIPVTGSKN